MKRFILIPLMLISCISIAQEERETDKWTFEMLKSRAIENQNWSKRDSVLFKQDLDTYIQYREVFNQYPINKSPFPVAYYDYAVASDPSKSKVDGKWQHTLIVGEFLNAESDSTSTDLELRLICNEEEVENLNLVESRNYPYLTAEGSFLTSSDRFDWVFMRAPDGASFLIVNMKLFDLRFGKVVSIYPKEDGSFTYEQSEK